MPFCPTLKLMFAATAVTVAWPVHAGEPRSREASARPAMSSRADSFSRRTAKRRRFPPIAGTPGMTCIALSAALMTLYRLMPNIILDNGATFLCIRRGVGKSPDVPWGLPPSGRTLDGLASLADVTMPPDSTAPLWDRCLAANPVAGIHVLNETCLVHRSIQAHCGTTERRRACRARHHTQYQNAQQPSVRSYHSLLQSTRGMRCLTNCTARGNRALTRVNLGPHCCSLHRLVCERLYPPSERRCTLSSP